ncbi:MAG TPA: chromate resistance protein ChrB domain-containing protein [Gemmatimonadaceae bacterium]|nr:chromate resistance protein ChrB domain-containing protein [Gemmatimonadaceae bacterium]
MNAPGGDAAAERTWLLLFHQIPPKPDYLRVKIGRRLQRIGAVPVKNSVYVLPDRGESLEDFQWVRAEVIDGGGDASICRAAFVDGLTNEQIEHLFRSARDAEYSEIARAARDGARRGGADDELARLRKRFSAVMAIDFCHAPGRAMAADALQALADQAEPDDRSNASPPASKTEYRGRVWVTRTGVFVDRIASAWLIRRFIDRDARFRFVAHTKARRQANEVRFDMVGGEFTHVGDRCTFETLLDRFALTDPALQAIGEIVHDIDLKDEKFGREDAAGIERVLSGVAAAHDDDDTRLSRGAQLFDDLYALFAATTGAE